MEALKNNGIKPRLLVRDKQTDQISVLSLKHNWMLVWKFVWERTVIWRANRFKKNNLFAVDIANTGTDITLLPEFKEADIIHLHWINQGMLSLRNLEKILASGKPVVWTMHDMWPCTGICHHARECDKYHTHCHHCPFLYGGGGRKDLSYGSSARSRSSTPATPSPSSRAATGSKNRHAAAPSCRDRPSCPSPTPSTPTSSGPTTRPPHA